MKMLKQIFKDSGTSTILVLLLTILALLLLGFAKSYQRINNEGFESSLPGKSMIIIATDSTLVDSVDFVPPLSVVDLDACIDCHEGLIVNKQKRLLTGSVHEDLIFDHPGFEQEISWCYYCHQTGALEKLILKNGNTITYQQSYGLCVQCHLREHREWEVGIHGKRIGEWNGKKQYMSCVDCHDPHSPRIQPLEPMKPPFSPNQY